MASRDAGSVVVEDAGGTSVGDIVFGSCSSGEGT